MMLTGATMRFNIVCRNQFVLYVLSSLLVLGVGKMQSCSIEAMSVLAYETTLYR